MRYVTLGRSGLVVSVVGLGCNNFGGRLDAERDAGRRRGCARRGRHALRHRRHLRQSGRQRGAARPGPARAPRRGRSRDEVRPGHARGQWRGSRRARVAPLHPPRGRGLASPPPDRPHRPLPVPRARRRDPDRGDPRRARRARRGGQGPLHRLLELRRLAGRGGRLDRAPPRSRAVRQRPERVQPARALGRAPSWCPPASATASASCPSSHWRAACSPASTGAASRRPRARALAARTERLEDADFDRIERLEEFAAAAGRSLLDLAIGGLADRPGVTSVIAGATSAEQVRANVRAGSWVPSADEREALAAI